MREQVRDDPPGLTLQDADALELGCELGLQLDGQVHDAALIVLRDARIESECPSIEVQVPALQREHFRLHPPAERVRDAHRDLSPRGLERL